MGDKRCKSGSYGRQPRLGEGVWQNTSHPSRLDSRRSSHSGVASAFDFSAALVSIMLYADQFFYKSGEQPSDAPDIICSTGRGNNFFEYFMARKYAAKNFFVGTLRNLPHDLFTAFITPLSIEAPNHIKVDVPLTDIDRDALQTDIKFDVSDGARPIWALLIGGKTAGYGFERQDWLNLAKSMQNLSEKHGGKWLLTTSRRTGTDVEGHPKIRRAIAYILDAVWHSDDKRKVVKPFLNAAEAVFCTEDSMAMLGEAVSAGKPVYSLRPRDINLDWKETEIVSHLEQGKKYAACPVRLADNQADLPPLEISIYMKHRRSTIWHLKYIHIC